MLRELAISVPTFFFQQVQPFFDNIFVAVWDPKLGHPGKELSPPLDACLILTTQREQRDAEAAVVQGGEMAPIPASAKHCSLECRWA